MYFVYTILSLKRNWIYVGLTNNVQRRIKEHNQGWNHSTKAYAPFRLLFVENYSSRMDARKREKYLKSAAGKRWIRKTLLCGPV